MDIHSSPTSSSTTTYRNPIIEQRADPWVYRHTDDYYYFTGSVPSFDYIELRRATRIQDLADAEPVIVWRKPDTGPMSHLIWAPEIHYIHQKWYIYFAAAATDEIVDGLFQHRMFVLENDHPNPLEGTWVEKGQIITPWDTFALDATTFIHQDEQYLLWAQKEPEIDGNSNLYLSVMDNPWTLKGTPTRLSIPELSWECIGFKVNEGPAFLRKQDQLFISYSASATDHHYCMGLLTADIHSDILNAASWIKSDQPVFGTAEAHSQYGPGHNCFTVSEDGQQDVMIYHARNYKEISGNPLYDPNRHMRAQIIHWNADHTPNFGVPVADHISTDQTASVDHAKES